MGGVFNNGINWDRKDTVFVADSVGKRIAVYKLHPNEKAHEHFLEFDRNIYLPGFPDNIEYDV
jgi:sugar lactone lactonase YvrE